MLHNLTPEQAAEMLLEYDLTGKFLHVARMYGISGPALWRWFPYRGLNAEGIRRVKALEHEIALISNYRDKIKSEFAIARRVIIRFQPSPMKRAALTTALMAHYGITHAAAYRIMGLGEHSGLHQKEHRNEVALVSMMKDYLAENPGHGFRLLFKILLRDKPNGKGPALKLYNKYGLVMNKRKIEPRVPKRVFKPMAIQVERDVVWSMDLMTDVLPNGRRFWVINVLDDFNREAVIVKAIKRPTAKSVIEALADIVKEGRKPKCIRTDNGMEFKSVSYKFWARKHCIFCEYTRLQKPSDNAYIERFNGTLRREIFNHFKFKDLSELQRMLDDWRIRYNLGRPHSALDGLSPAQFTQALDCRRRKGLT